MHWPVQKRCKMFCHLSIVSRETRAREGRAEFITIIPATVESHVVHFASATQPPTALRHGTTLRGTQSTLLLLLLLLLGQPSAGSTAASRPSVPATGRRGGPSLARPRSLRGTTTTTTTEVAVAVAGAHVALRRSRGPRLAVVRSVGPVRKPSARDRPVLNSHGNLRLPAGLGTCRPAAAADATAATATSDIAAPLILPLGTSRALLGVAA